MAAGLLEQPVMRMLSVVPSEHRADTLLRPQGPGACWLAHQRPRPRLAIRPLNMSVTWVNMDRHRADWVADPSATFVGFGCL